MRALSFIPESKEIVDQHTRLQLLLRLPDILIEASQFVNQIQSLEWLCGKEIPVRPYIFQINFFEILQ